MGHLSPAVRLWFARAEPALVIAAAPLLLFPRAWLPWLGLALLPTSWLLRRLGTGRWFIKTPFDRPIAAIFLMTPIVLYASVDLSLSMPKLYGILLGFAVFYGTVSYVTSRHRFAVALGLLAASIVAVSALGLVGTEWIADKYAILVPVYRLFPKVITEVQSSVGPAAGFQPNELGGTLAFLLPPAIALLCGSHIPRLAKMALGLITFIGLGVVALSASRSAALGLFVALLALLVWRWRLSGLALLSAIAVVLGVSIATGTANIVDVLLRIDSVNPTADALQGRLEVWSRALTMIADFPFTGIGLNTYPSVLQTLYPTLLADAEMRISHAHNIFLQTAVDLGLGGLLAFVGLSAITAYVGWQAYSQAGLKGPDSSKVVSSPRTLQAAVLGIVLGLLSYLIFGVTNAISLGAKPAVLLWLMMGLIVAAHRLPGNQEGESPAPLLPDRGNIGPARRALGSGLALAGGAYWTMAFFFVAMGYVVTVLGITGWIL